MKDHYDTDNLQNQYIDFHYGKDRHFDVDNFPCVCVETIGYHVKSNLNKVLDVGCAVGRSSFELAKIAKQVDASDFSANLLEVPIALQSGKIIRYSVTQEGDIG